jgi:2-haloacid dehalogenase
VTGHNACVTSDDRGGIEFGQVEVLTFDCYGTLIDWETGILNALRHVVPQSSASDDEMLRAYASEEAAAESGTWAPYREILSQAMSAVCAQFGHLATEAQAGQFGSSVAEWPPFPDSADALRRLAKRFDLCVITNCDDDLFAHSSHALGDPFRWVVTAEQARSYKPDTHNFEVAFERIARPRKTIVHVAQSLYHDHVPAKALGLKTVWVNRRAGRTGAGATPAAVAIPDLVVPDMASLAELAAHAKPARPAASSAPDA